MCSAWPGSRAEINIQRLLVLPELDLTVSVTAGNYDDPDQGRTPQTVLEQVILPAMA